MLAAVSRGAVEQAELRGKDGRKRRSEARGQNELRCIPRPRIRSECLDLSRVKVEQGSEAPLRVPGVYDTLGRSPEVQAGVIVVQNPEPQLPQLNWHALLVRMPIHYLEYGCSTLESSK